MTGLYIFFLAVGGPLLVWFAFAGDADADGFGGDADGDGPFSVIPLSTLAFVMAFFGATGLILGATGASAVIAFVLAVLVGAVAGTLNSAAFAWIRRNSASSDVSDRELEGSIGTATMPIGPSRRGRIIVEIAGAREQMTASPADGSDIQQGSRVVIVGIEQGVALVAPLGPELEIE